MLINTDYIDPAELTGYVRAAFADLPVNQFRLARFLPYRNLDDLLYRFTKGGEGLTEAATFRAYDAESPIGSRPGIQRTTGELPPISRKIRLGEYDRLRQRHADDAIRNQILDDATRMMRAVAARQELARGQALSTGAVTINENGIVAEADYGRQANHTTTPPTVWSDTVNATVLSDLVVWRDRYVETTGSEPGISVTSTTVLRLVQRNEEIINAVAGSAAGRTRVNLDELNTLLASEGIPQFEVNDARVSVAGSSTRVVPESDVIMLPAPVDVSDFEATDLGASLWGPTAEALDPDFGIEEEDAPGIVAGAYSTKDPVAMWTKAAGIGLPVLANPNLSLAADVI